MKIISIKFVKLMIAKKLRIVTERQMKRIYGEKERLYMAISRMLKDNPIDGLICYACIIGEHTFSSMSEIVYSSHNNYKHVTKDTIRKRVGSIRKYVGRDSCLQ